MKVEYIKIEDAAHYIKSQNPVGRNPDPKLLDAHCEKVKRDVFRLYNLKPPGPTIKHAELSGSIKPNTCDV